MNTEIKSTVDSILNNYQRELSCIRYNRDPRMPFDSTWLTASDIIDIHTMVLFAIGGKSGITNMEDLVYIVQASFNDGMEDDCQSILLRICRLSYNITQVLIDCKAETASVIFMTLCKLNKLEPKVNFDNGFFYDTFPKVVSREIDWPDFKHMIFAHF